MKQRGNQKLIEKQKEQQQSHDIFYSAEYNQQILHYIKKSMDYQMKSAQQQISLPIMEKVQQELHSKHPPFPERFSRQQHHQGGGHFQQGVNMYNQQHFLQQQSQSFNFMGFNHTDNPWNRQIGVQIDEQIEQNPNLNKKRELQHQQNNDIIINKGNIQQKLKTSKQSLMQKNQNPSSFSAETSQSQLKYPGMHFYSSINNQTDLSSYLQLQNMDKLPPPYGQQYLNVANNNKNYLIKNNVSHNSNDREQQPGQEQPEFLNNKIPQFDGQFKSLLNSNENQQNGLQRQNYHKFLTERGNGEQDVLQKQQIIVPEFQQKQGQQPAQNNSIELMEKQNQIQQNNDQQKGGLYSLNNQELEKQRFQTQSLISTAANSLESQFVSNNNYIEFSVTSQPMQALIKEKKELQIKLSQTELYQERSQKLIEEQIGFLSKSANDLIAVQRISVYLAQKSLECIEISKFIEESKLQIASIDEDIVALEKMEKKIKMRQNNTDQDQLMRQNQFGAFSRIIQDTKENLSLEKKNNNNVKEEFDMQEQKSSSMQNEQNIIQSQSQKEEQDKSKLKSIIRQNEVAANIPDINKSSQSQVGTNKTSNESIELIPQILIKKECEQPQSFLENPQIISFEKGFIPNSQDCTPFDQIQRQSIEYLNQQQQNYLQMAQQSYLPQKQQSNMHQHLNYSLSPPPPYLDIDKQQLFKFQQNQMQQYLKQQQIFLQNPVKQEDQIMDLENGEESDEYEGVENGENEEEDGEEEGEDNGNEEEDDEEEDDDEEEEDNDNLQNKQYTSTFEKEKTEGMNNIQKIQFQQMKQANSNQYQQQLSSEQLQGSCLSLKILKKKISKRDPNKPKRQLDVKDLVRFRKGQSKGLDIILKNGEMTKEQLQKRMQFHNQLKIFMLQSSKYIYHQISSDPMLYGDNLHLVEQHKKYLLAFRNRFTKSDLSYFLKEVDKINLIEIRDYMQEQNLKVKLMKQRKITYIVTIISSFVKKDEIDSILPLNDPRKDEFFGQNSTYLSEYLLQHPEKIDILNQHIGIINQFNRINRIILQKFCVFQSGQTACKKKASKLDQLYCKNYVLSMLKNPSHIE